MRLDTLFVAEYSFGCSPVLTSFTCCTFSCPHNLLITCYTVSGPHICIHINSHGRFSFLSVRSPYTRHSTHASIVSSMAFCAFIWNRNNILTYYPILKYLSLFCKFSLQIIFNLFLKYIILYYYITYIIIALLFFFSHKCRIWAFNYFGTLICHNIGMLITLHKEVMCWLPFFAKLFQVT